jgi:hypothetical protein
MPRVRIGPAAPDRDTLDAEIARLRDLGIPELRNRWRTVFGRHAPSHLPRHLMFRVLAYRMQAEQMGDLAAETIRLLDRPDSVERAVERVGHHAEVSPGTVLGREWNGQMHRITVMSDGFAWKGTTYPSLSKIAFAITGTRWNGPKFFGLRDRPRNGSAQ